MKDFLGNKLNVGDKVIYMDNFDKLLRTGVIEGFTKTRVRITKDKRRSYDKPFTLKEAKRIIKRPPEDVKW